MAITTERLRQPFSKGGAQEIYREIKSDGTFLDFAWHYAFLDDSRIARNALWGLCQASDSELSALQPILDKLIDQAMQTEDSSVRRMTLSLIDRLEISAAHVRADFLDFCLDHMASMSEPSGVQSVCMKLAFRMCRFYPELMDELKRVLEAMEADYYLPAVKNVRNKILSGRFR